MAMSPEKGPLTCLDATPVVPMTLTDDQVATIARALSNTMRLKILDLFHAKCPRSVGEIVAELPLAQSTVSAHIRILREANVLHTQRGELSSWQCLNRSVLLGFVASVTELARREYRC